MYLTKRFYIVLAFLVLMTGAGYVFPLLFDVGRWMFLALVILVFVELFLLYHERGMMASRTLSERFSNGDDNEVNIRVESIYSFPVRLEIIDEIPPVFQRRDVLFRLKLAMGEGKNIRYKLRPTERGVYSFGHVRVFASTPIGLVQRRFTLCQPCDVKVYPSYLMLTRYELLAMSNNLAEMGIKKIRKVGNHTEFEQIKDYVSGDDFRLINWRATARTSRLMVNVYQDERSQQVFNIIDKGRVMQQAFRGMTYLDYAINASLVLSYIAMRKEDKAGVVTFSDHFEDFVPASRRTGHMQNILEMLYRQQTRFAESDYSALVAEVNQHITKRSLLILYTNFANRISMERQLPYLLQLNRRHRLLVVFFEDHEVKDYLATRSESDEEYYRHVVAEQFAYEQRLIVSSLKQRGILALLTTPEALSVDVLNKYLEIKTRELL
ncbi:MULTISPECIES: DUF58 domain-containing protein [Segatella]|uniref:DUF58 domain-containing protein n=3 Tax=Segatella hominis TaxID=2518605 RepID=A0A4Y8VN37_9BACT|nr:DUF58 domain-containing protein [Segatella hominis]MBD9273192.1 DUF58 domain-containing protein [Prevotella sp.]TFH81944.1 DUF58 domain-containing protein [Segatella hominis]